MMRTLFSDQKGAFSPFMFGMLMSITVFSAMMQKWSMEELKRQEERRLAQQSDAATQVVRAIENAILTENVDGDNAYDSSVTLERAQRFLSGGTGKNAAGDAIQFQSATTNSDGAQRIIVNTTDDAFIAADISAIQGKDGMKDFNEVAGTRMVDTESIRQRQITQSKEYLEMEAAQIYRAYVAYGFKFPTSTQYTDTINATTGLKDAWGQDFTYERKGDRSALLSFTAPWGYTVTKKLSMD